MIIPRGLGPRCTQWDAAPPHASPRLCPLMSGFTARRPVCSSPSEPKGLSIPQSSPATQKTQLPLLGRRQTNFTATAGAHSNPPLPPTGHKHFISSSVRRLADQGREVEEQPKVPLIALVSALESSPMEGDVDPDSQGAKEAPGALPARPTRLSCRKAGVPAPPSVLGVQPFAMGHKRESRAARG